MPVPIGNKEDITLRVLRLMKELSIFICEDTRTTKKLFSMYDIPYQDKQFFSLTSFTDKGKIAHYLNLIKVNNVGMLSDAGTPGLSDPGKLLVQICNENDLSYSVLPGANALIPAIVGAGFDTSSFVYLGFLPQKKGRQTLLQEAIVRSVPTFFYESVHRISKLFIQLEELGFNGQISIAREISKFFEQYVTCSFNEMKKKLNSGDLSLKGEFVVGLFPKNKSFINSFFKNSGKTRHLS